MSERSTQIRFSIHFALLGLPRTEEQSKLVHFQLDESLTKTANELQAYADRVTQTSKKVAVLKPSYEWVFTFVADNPNPYFLEVLIEHLERVFCEVAGCYLAVCLLGQAEQNGHGLKFTAIGSPQSIYVVTPKSAD